jgi:hypothetical protein
VDGDQHVAVLERQRHRPADVEQGLWDMSPGPGRSRLEQPRRHRRQAAGAAEVQVEVARAEQTELEQGRVEAAAVGLLVAGGDLQLGGAEDGVGFEVAAQEAQFSLTT